jgi:hypothetical protein
MVAKMAAPAGDAATTREQRAAASAQEAGKRMAGMGIVLAGSAVGVILLRVYGGE